MSMDPVDAVVLYISLLFSLCVHEASHAAMSNYCGDDTARLQGRLTLNPLAHIDLVGTVILPIIMLATSGMLIGWAKPVPFNPRNLRNLRRDPVLIAMAGPGANLLLAMLFIFLTRAISLTVGLESIPELLFLLFYYIIFMNLLLMVFNLIPVPPLDGHYVLNYFLPPAGQRMMQQIGPFGILIAILAAQRILPSVIPRMMGVVATLIGA